MFETVTIDELERLVTEGERSIARTRQMQAEALAELDKRGVVAMDGCRSIQEWVRSRLDVAKDTASDLVTAARSTAEPNDTHASFDRLVATLRLAAAGAGQDMLNRSAGLDIAGVRRLAARFKRQTRTDHRRVHADRHVALQPTIDNGAMRIHGLLPGFEARILEKALMQRSDELPEPPTGAVLSRGQRMADALVSIAQDSLDGSPTVGGTSDPIATIFVDAGLAGPTRGEAGATLDLGQPVGPDLLESILCAGRVEVTGFGLDGEPLAVSPTARSIPGRLRRAVLHRDQGCVIDGCHSRYRLQPHHIVPRSRGGEHSMANLATLCWFHHHVIVHRMGYEIDPSSPPGRRRLRRPMSTSTDPPDA